FGYDISEEDKAAGIIDVRLIETKIPELPSKKRERFSKEFQLPAKDINAIIYDADLASYFEHVISELEAWAGDEKMDWDAEKAKLIKSAAGWLNSKLLKLLETKEATIRDTKVNPENFAELIILLQKGTITSTVGQNVLEIMQETGGDPSNIVQD